MIESWRPGPISTTSRRPGRPPPSVGDGAPVRVQSLISDPFPIFITLVLWPGAGEGAARVPEFGRPAVHQGAPLAFRSENVGPHRVSGTFPQPQRRHA